MKIVVLFLLFVSYLAAPITAQPENSFSRTRTLDVQHYKVDLRFNRAGNSIIADSTVTLRPLSGSLSTIELDANDLVFSSVTDQVTGKNLAYKYDKRKIVITLEDALPEGTDLSIRFKYTAKPQKGIYFVSAVRSRGRVVRGAQVWTQGEAEETRHWIPSYDFPDDKATTEQIITVNAGETVIGNGELLSNTLNKNGTRTFHYKMPVPHSLYLTSFVVGTYIKIEDKYRDIPLAYYVYPGRRAVGLKAFGKTKDMFRIFEELTGVPYPYNKYDQTIVARFPFGGMENITATTLADSEILLADSQFGQEVVQDLVAHELAHSWFGNLVTCRNWAELWTNESFAGYMEAVYREKAFGRDNYIEKIQDDASQYFSYTSVADDAKHGLFNTTVDPEDDGTMFDPVVYNKGSAVLHTLREEIGDAAFWKGVNIYLTRHRFSNVETKDVRLAFEEASGRELTWFFEQWIFRSGHPVIGVDQKFNEATGELTLQFVQNAAKSENPLDLYTLPLEITIKTSQKVFTEKITLNERSEKLTVKTLIKPELVEIDKDYKIPLKELNQSRINLTK